MYIFNTEETIEKLKVWIKNYFELNGPASVAVIGISGGKDSTIVAKLCCEAIGSERVLGVMMPNGKQKDIEDARAVIEYLGIKYMTVNIQDTISELVYDIEDYIYDKPQIVLSKQAILNMAPRIRMTTLYAIAATVGGRVANTSNLSEKFIGYSTKWGDGVGDFSPLGELTCTEVQKIGYALGILDHLVSKAPADGLTGKTDEDNFGFSYEVLDKFIREGNFDGSDEVKSKINLLYFGNRHKAEAIPTFVLENY